MDITRHWRLKTTRIQLLASRCPITGAVLLPQSGAVSNHTDEVYVFEQAAQPRFEVAADDVSYARAAR